MQTQEILELVKQAKELGVKKVSINGIDFEFGEVTVSKPIEVNTVNEKELVAKPDKYSEMTDEEVLFWASGYGLELEEKRNQEKQKELEIETKEA